MMTITLTWKAITGLLLGLLAARYLYTSLMKYIKGSPYSFDPRVGMYDFIPGDEWQKGFYFGQASIIRKYGLEEYYKHNLQITEALKLFEDDARPTEEIL